MGKEKKFGTFPGVFTPSILTILGVIMYMRLGWVVGQSGIIGTLIIIVVAHIISITTGLSISSIATDKKIKAGGIYYILSRSLGLPMGGAIGVALFVGTALSISLYIVGFTENFLSIQVIANFLHLTPGVNAYRIVGSIVLVVLVILAFISTSLAIKSQYFILGAIVLSLVSIFVGFFVNTEFVPSVPVMFQYSGGESIEMVFAIFFPAATGFTAGVAMSGDLKNPKRNIPIGTLVAISVGFVIYMILSLGFGFFVNRDTLLSDNNVAMHVAWIPAFVVAGIWGATLSSALGGILGGPRILQALSKDRVTPKLFAKGYGESNEPRNALIMIFIIAEAGIMIGNLNVIAGVVTMFYLASYGFINLAYVLENWVSTDFRPTFKVANIFGIVGFIFAFIIMFKLDVVSMFVAFILIGLIYFILQRKQLKLDSGDVWQSVWISIVRKGLHILDTRNIEDRNWQPNIILFSGSNDQRPHLLEFGHSLVGKFGFLSNFDLTVDTETDVLFSKHQQSVPSKDNGEVAIFTRRQSCKNIYSGIEMIVRTYGFSGIEPNTVIMGWGRQSKDPENFVKLIQIINDLDYNILLMDYEKRVGFGEYKLVDIWWRGAGNNGNFAITLAKFMLSSDLWESAKIRLMIVNNEDSKAFYIYREATEILKNMRIDAEVKIINNEVEQAAFYDIIRTQSKKADIVFIGIPSIQKGHEKEFVERTNVLLHNIGTVVLLKASSQFKELNLGVNLTQKSILTASENINIAAEISLELTKTKQKHLYNQTKNNFEKLVNIYDKTIATFTFKEVDIFLNILDSFKIYTNKILSSIEANSNKYTSLQKSRYVSKYQKVLNDKVNQEIILFKNKYYEELKETMLDVLFDYKLQNTNFLHEISQDIVLIFDKSEFKINKDDKFKYRLFKILHRKNEKNNKVFVKFKAKSIRNTIKPSFYEVLSREIEQIRIETLRFIYNFEKNERKLLFSLNKLKNKSYDNANFNKDLIILKEDFHLTYQKLEIETKNIILKVAQNRKRILLKVLNIFLKNSNNLDDFYSNRIKRLKPKIIKHAEQNIENKNELFFVSIDLFMNYVKMKNQFLSTKSSVANKLKSLSDFVASLSDKIRVATDKQVILPNLSKQIANKNEQTIKFISQIVKSLPKSVVIMEQGSLNDSLYKNLETINTLNILMQNSVEQLINTTIISGIKTQLSDYQNVTKNLQADSSSDIKATILEYNEKYISKIKQLRTDVMQLKIHQITDIAKKNKI